MASAGPRAAGHLERAVLRVLWDSAAPAASRDMLAALAGDGPGGRELAVTTVLTVLDRLRRKGLVRRERSGRAHLYSAAVSREDYVAGLMVDALGQAPDRGAALTRFVGSVSPAEADYLRCVLAELGGWPAGAPS